MAAGERNLRQQERRKPRGVANPPGSDANVGAKGDSPPGGLQTPGACGMPFTPAKIEHENPMRLARGRGPVGSGPAIPPLTVPPPPNRIKPPRKGVGKTRLFYGLEIRRLNTSPDHPDRQRFQGESRDAEIDRGRFQGTSTWPARQAAGGSPLGGRGPTSIQLHGPAGRQCPPCTPPAAWNSSAGGGPMA